ncbi:MAG: ribulose-phosphate 3-epimerase [Anaerolineales bacterium]|nr:ribulose-phosphate 3-epimerase [Anaerolineales bacterium]
MLHCSASLWSADLANLAGEIKRIEPYTERFHIDVADGQYVNLLLFFPDLVKALRPHTQLPFEVHLITINPEQWLEPFVDAGADTIIFYYDTVADPAAFIRTIKATGKKVGMSLRVQDPVELLAPHLADLDIVTVMGTYMGVKGVAMDPSVPGKIAQLRRAITQRGLHTEIEADGGIRYATVPLLHQAGVDWIVPGSLIFDGDPAELKRFLSGLGDRVS